MIKILRKSEVSAREGECSGEGWHYFEIEAVLPEKYIIIFLEEVVRPHECGGVYGYFIQGQNDSILIKDWMKVNPLPCEAVSSEVWAQALDQWGEQGEGWYYMLIRPFSKVGAFTYRSHSGSSELTFTRLKDGTWKANGRVSGKITGWFENPVEKFEYQEDWYNFNQYHSEEVGARLVVGDKEYAVANFYEPLNLDDEPYKRFKEQVCEWVAKWLLPTKRRGLKYRIEWPVEEHLAARIQR